ncbi:MAG: lipoyl(octanoyl) transferase LipB [Gammaproteobacteria bacterium]|nr:lipoyl(octanoyl) transferase LipB [Gammaproteobacteria bacterium]
MTFSKTIVRYLGMTDYSKTWGEMKNFTRQRDAETIDQIWITEHPALFTQGHNGKAEHIFNSGDIPVMQIDRGGQVTYHGPGQLLIYCLLDISRLGFGVRALVTHIESATINFLNGYGIDSHARPDAPGVYVDDAKIAALGLRIRKGCCYHGLSLNVDMDLSPFQRINPCGYENLAVTQLADLNIDISMEQAGYELAHQLIGKINRE